MSELSSYDLGRATERKRAELDRSTTRARVIEPPVIGKPPPAPATRARLISSGTPTPTHRRSKGMAGAAAISLGLLGVVLGGRALLAAQFPSLLPRWDLLWRQPFEQQVTGFVVLALFAAALIYPLRKRLHLAPRRTAGVRLLHAVLGTLALVAIVAHTDLRMGANLNRLLSIAFLIFAGLGSLGSFSGGSSGGPARLRRAAAFAHRVLLWPALALIGLHVLAVYYF